MSLFKLDELQAISTYRNDIPQDDRHRSDRGSR